MLRINPISHLITSILLFAMLCTSTSGKTIYVDDDATGANDGTSWENAYVYLQDALADANSAEKPIEIRVAQGIYKPDQGQRQKLGDQGASFQLINEVAIKGGFAGFLEPDPNARYVELYKTILCGDLEGNDVDVNGPSDLPIESTRSDNCVHVVRGSSTDQTAILDGFIITGGCSVFIGIDTIHGGAGMYNSSGSPMINNCTFIGNSANMCGGGMLNLYDSNPTITSCTFSNNYGGTGGGICNINSSPTLTYCSFEWNYAKLDGGGMDNEPALEPSGYKGSDPKIIDCIFNDNYAGQIGGGGIKNSKSDPNLTSCTFNRNTTAASGGGMLNDQSNPVLISCGFIENNSDSGGGGICNRFNNNSILLECMFIGNWSQEQGGGIFDRESNSTLNNCIFSGNYTLRRSLYPYNGGGSIYFYEACNPVIMNCLFIGNWGKNGMALCSDSRDDRTNSIQLKNCILWNGGKDISNLDNSIITITYSDIQGGWEGEGNIDVDPLFASPGFWADVNDPNIVVEPNEPNAVWIGGDYHLKSEAGRWDPVSESWVVDDVTSPCIDAGDPNSPVGDEPEPNGGRINMGAYGGTAEASKSPAGAEQIVYIQWLGHASVKVWTEDCIVYVDPQRLSISPHDATFVLVTHTHSDHYSPSDIARVSNAGTQFIAPPDVVSQYGSGQTIAPGQTIEFDFVTVKAVPAYNINKTNHPKSNNWVGYIIELGGKRIYVAGDTDLIEEMKSLGDINVAFLPAGGTYTMNATEAAEATGYIKPDLAIPYHWGQVVGTLADAQRFVELARCPAMVMAVGETISSDNWPEYSPLIAHWALDETGGDIAHDSAGDNNGTLYGEPVWQPAGGKIDGALQFDGIDDYVSVDFVLDPANGPFSVFAWIKGSAAGRVVISQADGTGSGEIWLGADTLLGKLMTGLVPPPAGRFVPQPLVSEFVVTDGQWHHIGFVWDSSYRILYADGAEVAKDAAAQNPLKSASGGLYIGAGKTLEAATFFSGLIDDVRIYSLAVTADEIEALVR
jgi:L-ascorbate metabolism protein UlaG (beta-lactamase superfamily)